jgi:hypothetical protein
MLVSHTPVTFLSVDFTPKLWRLFESAAVAVPPSGLRSRQFVLSVPVAGSQALLVEFFPQTIRLKPI